MVTTLPPLKLYCLNTRSVNLLISWTSKADIFALTETWFTDQDIGHKIEITPPGFKLKDHPRTGRAGGGTAVVFRENMHVSEITEFEFSSFEYSEWIIKCVNYSLRLVIVYRPPPYSISHLITTSVFFTEFSSYLESIVLSSEPLLITGDFIIHMDEFNNTDTVHLAGNP